MEYILKIFFKHLYNDLFKSLKNNDSLIIQNFFLAKNASGSFYLLGVDSYKISLYFKKYLNKIKIFIFKFIPNI